LLVLHRAGHRGVHVESAQALVLVHCPLDIGLEQVKLFDVHLFLPFHWRSARDETVQGLPDRCPGAPARAPQWSLCPGLSRLSYSTLNSRAMAMDRFTEPPPPLTPIIPSACHSS